MKKYFKKFTYSFYFFVLIFWFTNYSLYAIDIQNKNPIHLSTQADTVALIVSDKNVLSSREQAVFNLLNKFGMHINLINYSEATLQNLSNFEIIIATDNGAISSDNVYQLIFSGKKVVLLYDAGKVLGGNWSSYYRYEVDRSLYIESREAFLRDYIQGAYFLVQQSNDAWFIYSDYPTGWNAIGRIYHVGNRKTAFYRTHTSGGKGVILTYDPLYFTTDWGEDLFKRIIGYVTNTYVVEPVIVPAGNVAFIIRSFDDQTPTLTDRENSVKIKLWDLGYTGKITFISNARIWVSDLSKATFVIATEHPVVDKDIIDSLMIKQKVPVILLYNSAGYLGGNWSSDYGSYEQRRSLYVEQKAGFLKDYILGAYFLVQQSNVAYYIYKNYPSGWQIIGRNGGNETEKTALYRIHTGGGKGVILTYDPLYFTTDWGEDLFKRIIAYVTNTDVVEPVIVPVENVAFIIRSFDDQTPTLTDRENSVKIKLWDLGYINKITFISNARVWVSDLSEATFVIATEHPVVERDLVDSLMIKQKVPVILLYNSAGYLGGNWSSDYGSYEQRRSLYVEQKAGFLRDYRLGAYFLVQQSNVAYYIYKNYPSGWQIIGRNGGNETEKTALYKSYIYEDTTKGAIFTYDPRFFTLDGDTVFKKIVNWAKHTYTKIGNENKSTISLTFSLYQNYPNPFNPTTTIQYQLPKVENVEIAIYNTLGQKIRTLVKKKQTAGTYQVLWDGKDDQGRPVASGVYIYRIKAGDFVKARKMVLMK